MEFDWINPNFDLSLIGPKEIEESFEDPYCIKIFPEGEGEGDKKLNNRYYLLGKSIENRGIFCCFWTDGKIYRVIMSRDMTDDENNFYERSKADFD